MNRIITTLLFLVIFLGLNSCQSEKQKELEMENYFAWCIVPFDNQNRTPEQRIDMLKELGFVSYAYDWRTEHLSETVREFKLAEENGIKVNAVWLWIDQNDTIGNLSANNKAVLHSIKEAGLKTQIWMSYPEDYFDNLSDEESLNTSVEMISYLCDEAKKLNCGIGLYNHGGWFGNPDNLVKVVKALPEKEVGIIFNFHHAHNLLDNYSEMVENMMPHLWAVNLNGMNPAGPKIIQIGKGTEEQKMIQILKDKGYKGPYGILGHIEEADVKLVLEGNLKGLKLIQ